MCEIKSDKAYPFLVAGNQSNHWYEHDTEEDNQPAEGIESVAVQIAMELQGPVLRRGETEHSLKMICNHHDRFEK